MEPRVEKWKARAALPDLPWNLRTYAESRVRGIRRPLSERVARCNVRGVMLRCACRGRRTMKWYGCRQHMVCSSCARARARRMTRRITEGLSAAVARAERGRRLVLITLTLRHSGDVAQDRKDLSDGWRGLYKALRRRGLAFDYAGVVEVTPGEDGLGHVHMHIVALWPWISFKMVRDLWLAACPRSERITFVGKRRDGRRSTAKSAAKYIGKYVSKGVQSADFTPELRADVLAAMYQARMVFTSQGFWQPFEPKCTSCNTRRFCAIFRWHGNAAFIPGPVVDDDDAGAEQLEIGLANPNERAGPGCS